MKKFFKYTYLFFYCLTFISPLKPILSTQTSNTEIILTQKYSSNNFRLNSWLVKRLRKTIPPIQLRGGGWLPSLPKAQTYQLSLEFLVQSLANIEIIETQTPQIYNRKKYLEHLNELLEHKIHSVVLKNISNQYLYNQLNPAFRFDSLESASKSKIRQSLAFLIRKLKKSGYFSNVSIKSSTNQKTIIFYLELHLNPILTEIEFIGTQNLLIPKEELQEFSKDLIGYPNSLTQLNLVRAKIKHWYKCRGYHWVHIHSFTHGEAQSKIYFEITEGILKDITYKLCPLLGHEIDSNVPLNKFIPVNFIDAILLNYIKKGTLPNILNIEKAMHALKDTRFFYNFYYDINFIPKTNSIELIIHFVPYRDNELQTIINKSIKQIDKTNPYETRIQNLINLISPGKNSIYLSNLFLDTDFDIKSTDVLAQCYIYGIENNSYLDKYILNFDIQNSRYDIELGLDENFHLNQYHSEIYFFENLRYLRHDYDFINFTFKEKDYNSQFDFSYDMPLNIEKRVFLPLATRLFENITLVKSEEQVFQFNDIISKKTLIKNTAEFKRRGIDFLFKRKFFYGENLTATVGTRIISYSNINFYRNLFFHTIYKNKLSLFFPQYKNSFYGNFLEKKEQIKSILQKFTIYNFRVQLPFVDDLYHPTTGNFTQLDSIQLQPHLNLNRKINFLQQTNNLYFFKNITYLRTRPKYEYSPYHLVIFKIFIGKITGPKIFFSLPDRLRYQRLETRQTGYLPIQRASNSLNEYLFEYHLRISKYTNPVISLKFFKDSPLLEEYPFPHIQGEFFYSHRLDLYPMSSGNYLGLGWEFRTMIPQIPVIRIEFIQKIPGKGKICLRVIPYLY